MKIRKNSKLAGRLLMASGVMFFAAAVMTRQPAFSGVGAALFVIGAVTTRKKDREG
jgi:membrane-bound ClpP family serine protease